MDVTDQYIYTELTKGKSEDSFYKGYININELSPMFSYITRHYLFVCPLLTTDGIERLLFQVCGEYAEAGA